LPWLRSSSRRSSLTGLSSTLRCTWTCISNQVAKTNESESSSF
jgi:hypothetical protein